MAPQQDRGGPLLRDALQPQRATAVCDIGANPIDGEPPYRSMLEQGLCTVVGFEPQSEALSQLRREQGPLETYLPYVIADGHRHTLHRCRTPGMTGLFAPAPEYLGLFNDFTLLGDVIGTGLVETRTLDSIEEIEHLDFLKIDVQGSELMVFESGRSKLSRAVAIQTEVSFMPLYRDQPLFWEVDRELRAQGFVPHAFDAVKRWPLSPYRDPKHPRVAVNQLLEADVVYVRDFVDPGAMDPEQLKHLALIAHCCYGSYDLVVLCLKRLVDVGAAEADLPDRYLRLVHATPSVTDDLSAFSMNISFRVGD
jgi:FkbM family methyltransferase